MNKTNIEWCDYTINPVKGLCPMACDYCYARRMYKRFKWSLGIRYVGGMYKCRNLPPSRIFVGSTMELFGDWIDHDALRNILNRCTDMPQHTFIFLTKQPQNLIKWSQFPDNCWVGVTATDLYHFVEAHNWLISVEAKVKFISFEPLLSWGDCEKQHACKLDYLFRSFGAYPHNVIDWLIIGQQTPVSAKTQPQIEWVKEIVEAADKAGIPLFLKDNLRELLCRGSTPWAWQSNTGLLRQEMPHAI